MRIIIIGAGVSGLSLYLFLKKHLLSSDLHDQSITITIYEAYDIHNLTTTVKPISETNIDEPVFTPVALGNAIGISANGLQVLGRLDDDGSILRRIKERGNPVAAWRMSNMRGWTLAKASVTVKRNGRKPVGDMKSDGCDDMMVMIARQDLWEVLRDEAVKDGYVVVRKRVKDIEIGRPGNRSRVSFEDGTYDEADLVIGADGLRSALRRAMFATKKQPQQQDPATSGLLAWTQSWLAPRQPAAVDLITPQYEGLAGVGGFIPTKELQRDPNFDAKTMNIVFGRNGFFGYGCISSPPLSKSTTTTTICTTGGPVSAWWSTFASPIPYPYHDTSPSTTSSKFFNASKAVSALLARHRSWQNTAIQQILTHTETTGLTPSQFYPTWTTPPLPSWQKNGTVVLIGDAAHALQPSSGQGASQALEDAEALALLLKYCLQNSSTEQNEQYAETGWVGKAVAKALQMYETLRRPRVKLIYERSQKMGKMKNDMGVVMEMVVYCFVWAMSFFHDKHNDTLFDYDLPHEVESIVARNRESSLMVVTRDT